MKIESISASGYNSFEWCQFQYYLKYILNMPDEFSPSGILGSCCHRIFEILSRIKVSGKPRHSRYSDLEYLWKLSEAKYAKESGEIWQKIPQKKIDEMKVAYLEFTTKSDYSPIVAPTIDVEKYFNLDLHGDEWKCDDKQFKVKGFIDRVDKINDTTIEIIDYKSGSSLNYESAKRQRKDPDSLKAEIQPRMYHMAARTLYPAFKNVLVTFIYFRDQHIVSIPFSDKDIKETKNKLYKSFLTIDQTNFPSRSRSWKCDKICGFGPNGTCEKTWQEIKQHGHDFVELKYRKHV
jgi:hypothetical protein